MTERDAGSDPSRIEATATRTDGGWRINGEKWFVTSGDVATVLIVMANLVDGADRLPTLFLVDRGRPGVEVVDDPDFTHSYPDGHPTIRFTDVEVGPEDVIGGIGDGDDLQRAWFTEERLGIAARGVGAMWRLLEETVDWATAREQGGERIYDYQGVSFPLADSAADAAAGRLLALQVAAMIDAGADPKLVHAKASMAKLFVSEAAWRCADRGVQVVRRPRLHAHQRRRAIPARAARRPDLGGHERDPAADHRAGPRAARGRAHPPLDARGSPAPAGSGASAGAALGRRRRRKRPAGLLRRHGPAQPGAGRLRRPGLGRPPDQATRCTGATACHPRRICPSRSTRSSSPYPRPRSPASLAEAAERGCRGAVVFAAGFGEAPGGAIA